MAIGYRAVQPLLVLVESSHLLNTCEAPASRMGETRKRQIKRAGLGTVPKSMPEPMTFGPMNKWASPIQMNSCPGSLETNKTQSLGEQVHSKEGRNNTLTIIQHTCILFFFLSLSLRLSQTLLFFREHFKQVV